MSTIKLSLLICYFIIVAIFCQYIFLPKEESFNEALFGFNKSKVTYNRGASRRGDVDIVIDILRSHNQSRHIPRVCAPPHFLIRPRTMHNKRALDRRLCRKRAAARLLSQQWRGLHSAAVLETPGKQGNNAPHELHFDGISRIWGCAHANKLSPSHPPPHQAPRPASVIVLPSRLSSSRFCSMLYREFRDCETRVLHENF